MTEPRGIRLNNPGNINRNNIAWEGLASSQPDPRFCAFTEPRWGIRAAAKIILNGAKEGHRTTVEQIVTHWAPPSENNTSAYVDAVTVSMGVTANQELDLHDYETLSGLLKAIIKHENGVQPYPDDVFKGTLELLGIKPVMPPLHQTRGVQASAALGASGAIGLALQAAPLIGPATPLIQAITAAAPWALGIVIVLFATYILYVRIDERRQGIH